jgi:ribosomal protein S18 acetylase RimI-like enzyme
MPRQNSCVDVRLLGPGDEAVVAQLATGVPRTALLHDPRTVFLVAFEDDAPAGFVLAYELPRRHGFNVTLCIYEVEVGEAFRRRGVATGLFDELERIARERGIEEGFVLTDADNTAAMGLYESIGGLRSDVVEWDFKYADS